MDLRVAHDARKTLLSSSEASWWTFMEADEDDEATEIPLTKLGELPTSSSCIVCKALTVSQPLLLHQTC